MTTKVAVLALGLVLLFGCSETDRLLVHAYVGDAGAQTLLGTVYAHGKGVPQDAGKAIEWYRKAAEASSGL